MVWLEEYLCYLETNSRMFHLLADEAKQEVMQAADDYDFKEKTGNVSYHNRVEAFLHAEFDEKRQRHQRNLAYESSYYKSLNKEPQD